ncbi:peptidoglycan-binding protein [Amycolatopsis azurea]|uniref:peptidoglycan-binding domain-containing protein n=1 Tax=Amycolatopsis azurea TaxID=36819 RepID=UPI003814AF0D
MALQRRLNARFPACSRRSVDGAFGAGSESVVREFQRCARFEADGAASSQAFVSLW